MAVKPITQKEWDALSPKQKWDSIVGLRGPDVSPSDVIKWFTTSVIRARLSGVMRVGGQVNQDLNLVIIPSGSLIARKTGWGSMPPSYLSKIASTVPHDHPIDDCKGCAALRSDLDRQHEMPRWDHTHWAQHLLEAAQELSIPYAMIPGRDWWKAIQGGGTASAAKHLLPLLMEDWPDQARELDRHINEHLLGRRRPIPQSESQPSL